jgi:ubiquinone/menaquinone biosynthesis C-methylase UbiE
MERMQIRTADHRQTKRVVSHYAKLAPAYDRLWDRYTRNSLGKLVECLPLQGHEHLLDVACGTGRLAELLRRTHSGIRTTGIDLSPDMIKVARQRMPENATTAWQVGTLDSLKLEEGSFEVITCNSAFHLFMDQQGALERMARLVRPDGLVAIVDWCREFPQIGAIQRLARLPGRQHRNILTREELGGMLAVAGLEPIVAERFPATWFWRMMCVVARKPAPQ